jgi:F-type H+-transporting ATPase subunit gamma
MASLKAIRRRISSVKSTQQITRAMKFVAAARLRRSQEALFNARPYHEALRSLAESLLFAERAELAPKENAQRQKLVMVVASDRGLCGGYNTNLVHKAGEIFQAARAEGLETRFFAVGRKASDALKRDGASFAGESINNTPRLATLALARDLASRMLAGYRAGEMVEAGIVYSHFHSALSQRPTYERLLPVVEPREGPEEKPARAREYLIEPSRAALIPTVLRSYVQDSIFHALLEAEASEHGARMTAMDSATNNATDMISRLTLEMNRARQATITRELMDIVGGAEALRG